MKNYEMPYLFLLSDEELLDLWTSYSRIAGVVRCFQDRTGLAILDEEVRAGAHFRAKAIVAEAQRRESLKDNILLPRELPRETITILED